ncbi:hypothetical protein ACP70R_031055 [Stipagrostis hirtigluma subsp. patula]
MNAARLDGPLSLPSPRNLIHSPVSFLLLLPRFITPSPLPSTSHPIPSQIAIHTEPTTRGSFPISLDRAQMAAAYGTGMVFSVRPPAPARRACAASAAAGGAARARADGGKWWAPLLGWSGQPDYIDAQPRAVSAEEEPRPRPRGAAARRFGVLTEDKARQLRMRMMETESFHDAMYHSAIASRLASAAPDKP